MYKILISLFLSTVVANVFAATLSGKSYKDYVEYRDSFTDSQNRTSEYSYSLPSGHNTDSASGILIYLHGNNQVTQSEIIDGFSYYPNKLADEFRTFIPVVITSPDVRSDGITRQWSYDLDPTYVRELIDSHFEGQLEVDFNKVYFYGASQGTCFLHAMMMQKMEGLGGGMYAACGCNDYRDPYWEPTAQQVESFRIYFQSSIDDFLHTPATQAYEYYIYNTQLQVLGELDGEGGHCEIDDNITNRAIRFITGLDEFVPPTKVQHFKRLSVVNENAKISSISVGSNNELIYTYYDGTETNFLVSNNQGLSFSQLKKYSKKIMDIEWIEGTIYGFDSLSPHIDILDESPNVESISYEITEAKTFKLNDNPVIALLSNTGNIDIWSDDESNFELTGNIDEFFDGNNFKPNHQNSNTLLFGEYVNVNNQWDYTIKSFYQDSSVSSLNDFETRFNDFRVSSNGDHIVALGGEMSTWNAYLYYSEDIGVSWEQIQLPAGIDEFYSNYKIYLSNSNEIILTGMNSFYRSEDKGQTWTSIPNSSYLNIIGFASDLDSVNYAYSERAIYRFDLWNEMDKPIHTELDPISPIFQKEENFAKNFKYKLYDKFIEIEAQGYIKIKTYSVTGKKLGFNYSDKINSKARIELPLGFDSQTSVIKISHKLNGSIKNYTIK